jgi:mitochondrial import receptor subunit TOM40
MDAIADKRRELNLPFPGTAEHLQREVKGTLLTNYFFDGARADLTKAFSLSPIFQVTHAFSMGGFTEKGMTPSTYNFGAIYGSDRFFLQAGVDDSKSVTMRANTGWAPGQVSKIQANLTQQPSGNFIQLEHDYHGLDHAANVKALNPSPIDGSGIYIANYIQSLTRNFAVGLETVYQRQSADAQEAMMGYMAKWTSDDRTAIGTIQAQGQGVVNATYWQRLSDKVDVAGDLQIILAGGRREASTTLGARYDFRMSTFRAQIDNGLKVSSQLETRLAPAFAFTVGGEIDHFRGSARFGVGIALETPSSDLPLDPNAPPPTPPNVPM